MKRLSSTIFILLISVVSWISFAQKKTKATFEDIYRPVYGYIMDSITDLPIRNVTVYAFDSIDDARLGEGALEKRRNPMTLRLKGDVVETRTDESGRYMVPARSTGALVFYLKDRDEIIVNEIAGRSEVSFGRKIVKPEYDFDITEFLGKDYRREPGKVLRRGPEGVVLDMDFNAHIPQPGEKAKMSRVIVERRVEDLETGEILSSAFPIVRDGKTFHRQRRKMVSKGESADALYETAHRYPFLSDTTATIRVADHLDTEPWKERCFRLDYLVSMEHDGVVKPLDTLYIMTNRVNKPLKYLEYMSGPYGWEPEETTEQRRAVTRRLVLQGEYTGEVPEVLKDSSYLLRELHVKAVVAPDRPYDECIVLADTMVAQVMRELRVVFADKLNDRVRITKTSQVASDTSHRSKVEYRYIFSTGRHFSQNGYLRDMRKAKDDDALELLCRQAMQERQILEGISWDYAANVLASLLIRQGRTDASVLAPFIDPSLREWDIKAENPVTYEETVMNRREIVANQVLMLMLSERFADASSLAEILPEEHACLREVARCKSGAVPSDDRAVGLLRESSLRNSVLMDLLTDKVSASTLETLDNMSQEDAMTWFLRARTLCMMHGNEAWDMQNAVIEGSDQTVYAQVIECLRRCFDLDPNLIPTAKYDSEINEFALKEVLGVYVL